jgi:hypothetical protein
LFRQLLSGEHYGVLPVFIGSAHRVAHFSSSGPIPQNPVSSINATLPLVQYAFINGVSTGISAGIF